MKILFFFPSGGRTGSEMVLYNLICNANRRQIKMAVTCPGDGPLLTAFSSDVPIFKHANEEEIKLVHEEVRPDAWYVNTITQLNLLHLGRNLNVPCVLHTHELEQMLFDLTPEAAEEMVSSPELVIASSEAAAEVMRALGRKEGMEVSHSSIDIAKVKSRLGASAQIRTTLGIDKDDFVWMMSGTLDPNKNPGRFVEIAHALVQKQPRAHFMWIGGSESAYSRFIRAQIKKLGLEGKVTWIPALADTYYDHMDVADGFVLTSNRDCFPLVMIESAALGKPIVSFDSGGVREFFRPGMGVLIKDSWNVSDIAVAMIQVMNKEVDFDATLARKRAEEFDVSRQVKRWQSLLKGPLEKFIGKRDDTRTSLRTELATRDQEAAGSVVNPNSPRSPAFLTIYLARTSGYSEDHALEIPYWTQRWSHLQMALEDGLGISPLRVDPMKGPGVIDVAGVTIRSAKTGEILWRATRRAGGLDSLQAGGSALRLPHPRLARFFSYGEDPQILLPLLSAAHFAGPLRLEIWLKTETRPEPIREALAELTAQSAQAASRITEFHLLLEQKERDFAAKDLELEALRQVLTVRDQEFRDTREQFTAVKGKLDQAERQLNSSWEALAERDSEIERRDQELVSLQGKLAAALAERDRVEQERFLLEKQSTRQKGALEEASKLAVSTQNQLDLKRDEVEEISRELAMTTHELTRVAAELGVLKRRLRDQERLIGDLRDQPFWRALNTFPMLRRFAKGRASAALAQNDPAVPEEPKDSFWLEHPTGPSEEGEPIMVSGWVVTPSGERIEGVEARVNGEAVTGVHGLERADVGAAHQERSDYLNSGFLIGLNLPAGSHQVSLQYLTRSQGWTDFCSFQHEVFTREAPR